MPPVPDDTPIDRLKNLGPRSRDMLHSIDVLTAGDIRHLGIPLLFSILKDRHSGASMNLVYALEAALRDIHWLELTHEQRRELRKACRDD